MTGAPGGGLEPLVLVVALITVIAIAANAALARHDLWISRPWNAGVDTDEPTEEPTP